MQRIKSTVHLNDYRKLRVNKILRVIYAVIPFYLFHVFMFPCSLEKLKGKIT
jgi:hypothetical protein